MRMRLKTAFRLALASAALLAVWYIVIPRLLISNADQLMAKHRVMNQTPFEQFMTKDERRILLNILQTVSQIFQDHNATFFMYGGTLLGSHRHHGLIPWDDDADLLVNISWKRHLPDLLSRMAPSLRLHTHKEMDKVYHEESRATCQQSWCRWRWPFVDITYFEENQTHIWDIAVTYRRRFVFPKFLALPPHPRPLEHLWIPAPRDTLACLQLTYGMTSTCVNSPFSHVLDGRGMLYRRPCHQLSDRVAFVHRRPCSAVAGGKVSSDDACVLEALQLGPRVLRSETVAEPSYAINEPFALRLVDGFTWPKHYPDLNCSEIM